MTEVLGHASGDKLDAKLKLAERVREKLGRSALSKSTAEVVKASEALKRSMRKPSDTALIDRVDGLRPRRCGLASPLHPRPDHASRVRSNPPLARRGHPRFRQRWDREFSRARDDDDSDRCAVDDIRHGLEHANGAKTKFSIRLKSRFFKSLLGQDYEFYEAHGADLRGEAQLGCPCCRRALLSLGQSNS